MYLRAYRTPPEFRRVEGMTREEVCERYQRKILTLARRVCEQAGDDCPLEPEDLVSYGIIGLLEAFDRFDASHRVEFTSFASYRILGQMLDAVRAAGGTTRRQRQLLRDLEKAVKAAHEAAGREPTHREIAQAMGVDLDTYWQIRDMVQSVELVDLPAPAGEDGMDADPVVTEPQATRVMLARDARATLREAIARLPERERNVILLYYARDLSLAEIGAVLEVTPSRICQILSDARTRLRKALGREVDVELFSVEGAA
ncbi:MAG: polymerase sigma factor FliA [Pseudomonadota bacterium]